MHRANAGGPGVFDPVGVASCQTDLLFDPLDEMIAGFTELDVGMVFVEVVFV